MQRKVWEEEDGGFVCMRLVNVFPCVPRPRGEGGCEGVETASYCTLCVYERLCGKKLGM